MVWAPEQQSSHNTSVHGLRNRTTMQERVRGEVGSNSLRSQPDFDKISTQYHHPLKSAWKAAARDKATESERVWVWSPHCGGGADLHTETCSRFPLFIANVENPTHRRRATETNKEVGFGLKLIITMIFH